MGWTTNGIHHPIARVSQIEYFEETIFGYLLI